MSVEWPVTPNSGFLCTFVNDYVMTNVFLVESFPKEMNCKAPLMTTLNSGETQNGKIDIWVSFTERHILNVLIYGSNGGHCPSQCPQYCSDGLRPL